LLDVIVFYENFNNNFFYQVFKHKNKVHIPDSPFLVGDLDKLQKFINEESKKKKDFILVSNSNKFFSSLNYLNCFQKPSDFKFKDYL